MPRQPFVGLALAAMLGILLGDMVGLPASSIHSSAAAIAILAAVLFWRSHPVLIYVLVACSFFVLHNVRTIGTPGLRLAALLGEKSRVATATGEVVTEPKFAANGFSTFLMRLRSIEAEGEICPTAATIFVRWRGQPQFGDELKLFGVIEDIEPPRNPGQFDMRAYLARHDVRRQLFVRYAENSVILGHNGGNLIFRAAQVSRAWMQKALCRGLEDSPDVQNFLSGIVLGLRHQTPEDIEDPFQQTGTLHLFAVAGLHVGIVARLLWVLATAAQRSKKLAAGLIIPLLLFYATVTGLHVSSMRAAIMASILLGGLFFERKVFSLNSLAAAAFFLLSWNTNEFFATGFQLSFAVVGAIVLLVDPISELAEERLATDPFLPKSLVSAPRKLFHSGTLAVAHGTAVSAAAWIGSLVLILWYFHLIAPISLVANLAVVPIAFFVLAIALLSLVSAPLIAGLSLVFNNANWVLARSVIAIVHLFAQVPTGHFYLGETQWPTRAQLRMDVLDMGSGAAVHLRTSGKSWLFDCGNERDYERVIREYLRALGVNRLDGLLLSHGDAQHIGAAARIISDYRPPEVFDNPAPDRSSLHRRLRASFRQAGVPLKDVSGPTEFRLSNAVTVRVLFPPAGFFKPSADDQALVIQLATPSARILMMSDSGDPTEEALLESNLDLRSDILVKGKHHTAASSSDRFLKAVSPRLIIATSRDFPYSEHISEEWLNRVSALGIKLFRQDESGAVRLRFGPNDWEAQAYLTGETFRSSNR